MEQLVLQAVVDQLVEALAEDVRLPQADGVVLEILQKALHEVFALLLRPHDGTQLGVDDRLHHMDGRRAGLETDAVPPALPDDLGLFQRKLVDGRHHDAVAGGLHLLHRTAYLLVGTLGFGQLDDAGHQPCFVADFKARLLAEHLIKHLGLEQHRDAHYAVGEVHPTEGGVFHGLAVQRRPAGVGDVLHPGNFLGELHGRCVYLGLEPVAFVQHRHPAGQGEIQLPHRKLIEHFLQNLAQLRLVEVEAAHRQNGPAIALFHFRRQRLRLGGVGVGAVEQDDEGLAQRFQLVDDPLFCRDVVFAGYLADGAVGGDDDADGGVVPDDLAGAGLGGKVEGDLLVEPGAFDHPGLVILLVAHGPLHHIAHAVDEPDAALSPALQRQRHRRLRDELGLCGHDGAPRCRLGQLIAGAELRVLRADGGQHQLFHKLLDEGALARAHRPHHTNEDVAAGAGSYLAADCRLLDSFLLCQNALPSLPI